MVNINTMMKLKKKVKRLEQEKDRAKGRVDQLLKTLKEKYDCSTLKKAKEQLRRMEEELEKLASEYEKKERNFEKRWGHLLHSDNITDNITE